METKQKIKKNDFVELEFTGYVLPENRIFDTTDPARAKQIGLEKTAIKPTIISVGNKMILEGIDESLEGREVEEEYTLHLSPEKAFGKRNPSLIKTYSVMHFRKNNIQLYPGLTLQLDNLLARVISINGGRVILDFNNPLAGRELKYEIKIKRIITDLKEKVNAIQDYFLKHRYPFEIDEKNKKIIFKEKMIAPFLEMMQSTLKEMTGFEFVVEQQAKAKKQKPSENKNNPQSASQTSSNKQN